MRILVLTLCLWTGLANAITPISPMPGDWQVQLQRLQRLMLEQEQLLQQLQAEVRKVRGENEVLTHRIDELTKRQRNVSSDLDQRLSRLETHGTTASTESETGDGNTQAALLPASDNSTAFDTSSLANAESTTALTPIQENPESQEPQSAMFPKIPETSPAPNTDNEQEKYQDAFALLQAGQFDRAIQGFTSLLKDHPNGEYADNAQYWIGESQYVKHDYNAALRSFNAVLENYPNSNKRAHALLKIGYSYNALNNNKKARQVLEYVRDKFPNTATARLAKERLQRLR